MTGLRFKLPTAGRTILRWPAARHTAYSDPLQATGRAEPGKRRPIARAALPKLQPTSLPNPAQLGPRAQVRRLIWPLAALLTVFSAILQLLAGQTTNLPHDAVFLLLVGLCTLLDRWRTLAGSVLFFACLPVFLAWLTLSPGVGHTFITDFAGYSAALLLPTLMAALQLRGRGMLIFAVHAVVVGLLADLPLPADRAIGVVWSTGLSLSLGALLWWLLLCVDRAMSLLKSSALLDPLTGLANRRAFDADLSAAWADHAHNAAVLMMDVDDLKGLNDRYGHAAGDEMLRQFGRFLQAHLLPGTTAYRLGGDEFAVLCRVSQLAAARERVLLAAQQVSRPDRPSIQVSVGAASGAEVRGRVALVRVADERMYVEKRRNNPHRASSRPERPRHPTLIERLF
ncbi:GGDEF domain-containing protein [Deinococcus sp. Arct2-2]|uniref:GGDEF domain-containing protein n=1 Tax=Deinococcus sp. Arct2-2 TaxID=2568653 RepID=UPI0010A3F5A6|nr:GGDEF domain-containing protein [Deinococcus sp. Arct2-2]THF70251.1 GGDEF domain-containing protein [Deinococcus sp. Arct2-2]